MRIVNTVSVCSLNISYISAACIPHDYNFTLLGLIRAATIKKPLTSLRSFVSNVGAI